MRGTWEKNGGSCCLDAEKERDLPRAQEVGHRAESVTKWAWVWMWMWVGGCVHTHGGAPHRGVLPENTGSSRKFVLVPHGR